MSPTKIEWATDTWNPVTGCSKVSAGCHHCYAETLAKRFWGERKFTDVQCHEDKLDEPFKWRKPRMVFVNSMSDLFHSDVPFDFIDKIFSVMALAERHTFMILTKRPERMARYMSDLKELDSRIAREWFYGVPSIFQLDSLQNVHAGRGYTDCEWPLPNVWLGVSVEDQATADDRIPKLLQCPAAVRFVSYEPALGPVDFLRFLPYLQDDESLAETKDIVSIDWLVCGGESGPGARPMNPEWARSARDQCIAANVPFFFKQWGEWGVSTNAVTNPKHVIIGDPGHVMFRVGKKAAGRQLDRRTWDQYPERTEP